VHGTLVHKDQYVTVKGNQTLNVTNSRVEKIDQTCLLSVGDGGYHVGAEEEVGIRAKKQIVIASDTRIHLNVQGSVIEMLPNEIRIQCSEAVYFQMKSGGFPKGGK
jgi:hypothetical protein